VFLEVTGQPKLDITGRDGSVSAKAEAGKETTIPVVVTNSGTAPADQIEYTERVFPKAVVIAPYGLTEICGNTSFGIPEDPPELRRTTPGRAIANVLSLKPEEKITSGIPVRRFDVDHNLLMATRNGIVKKTPLTDYNRPKQGGIIGISLDEGDGLIDVALTQPGDEVLLCTRRGMAIRFDEADARAMGRKYVRVSLGGARDEADRAGVARGREHPQQTRARVVHRRTTSRRRRSAELHELPDGSGVRIVGLARVRESGTECRVSSSGRPRLTES